VGRIVGIISHLTSLNENMPARLVVHKKNTGSEVTRE
jgi:DNA repair exonuclease SbcCD ATPase subunit